MNRNDIIARLQEMIVQYYLFQTVDRGEITDTEEIVPAGIRLF